MRIERTRRSGFTLVEALVVVAILALLAAVLVPVLTSQLSRSDASRLAGDLNGIRKGVEAFLSDVRRYPGDLDDLAAPLTNADTTLNAGVYPAGLSSKWKGPYVDRILAANGDSVQTGFGAWIQDNFISVPDPNNINYLTVRLRPVLQADFNRVDEMVDGTVSPTAGRLRWFSGDSVHFLAVPIN